MRKHSGYSNGSVKRVHMISPMISRAVYHEPDKLTPASLGLLTYLLTVLKILYLGGNLQKHFRQTLKQKVITRYWDLKEKLTLEEPICVVRSRLSMNKILRALWLLFFL